MAFRNVLQGFISKTVVDAGIDARQKAAIEIEASGNSQLAKVGMQLSNLEIIEVWSRILRPHSTMGTN